MRRTIALAAQGHGRTSPNPMVGAVIARQGAVIAKGWHKRAGDPHAEAEAIASAGPQARGATLFVNLEPCAHQGRTPPCSRAIIAAGIERVVIAMVDPDPSVDSKGIAELEAAGVTVEVGLLEDEARSLNEAYVVHRTRGRPFVIWKSAMSIDARVAARDGSSRWITGQSAREQVHALRAEVDAVCVGIGTALADDPSLDARPAPDVQGFRQPLRVIVDSEARIGTDAKVFRGEGAPLIVTTCPDGSPAVLRLQEAGAETMSVEARDGKVDIEQMLKRLAERGVVTLLLEGGPTLAGSFLRSELIDKMILYVAPKILGADGVPLITGIDVMSLDASLLLDIEAVSMVGQDVRIDARPVRAD